MNNVDAVIGNSSSGLIEAPTLGVATINIGDRQKGRIRSRSVIDAGSNINDLRKAFRSIKKEGFKEEIKSIKNPYDGGQTSRKIVNELKKVSLNNLLKKQFYDY